MIEQTNFSNNNSKVIPAIKLIFLFLCIFNSNVMGNTDAQTISLKVNKIEIEKVLLKIESQSDFRFLYNPNLKDLKKQVSIDKINSLVSEILAELIIGTNLNYRILDNNLIAIKSIDPQEKQIKISGKITAEKGEPIAGASVSIKGSNKGTTTDYNGTFTLIVNLKDKLIITAIGYQNQEVEVVSEIIQITLKTSTEQLEEVVVIGYGTASKKDLTGSIVKVKGEVVADKPNLNPLASLQGQVAGLSIVNNGSPGGAPDIRIRGTISIGSVKPLFIVDGIFNDDITFVNPNDIESIEVLKDPSSLAIFGVRGASGVIVINTKRAKSGQININFNTNYGIKQLTDKIKLTNATEFKTLFEEEVRLSKGNISLFANYNKFKGNTDWIDALTQTGQFNTNSLSVVSSTDKNKFYFGIGFSKDQGIVKHQELNKITISLNDEIILNKHIKLGFNLNVLRQNNNGANADGLLYNARRVLPISNISDPTSGLYYDLSPAQNAELKNPVMELENTYDKSISIEYRYLGNIFAEINFLKNFTFKTTFYADVSNLEQRSYNPLIKIQSEIDSSQYYSNGYKTTRVNQSNQRWNKFQQDFILTYKKSFNDHNLTLLGGFTTYYNDYSGLYADISQKTSGDPIPNDPRFWYIDNGFGDKTTSKSSSGQWEKATTSYLFRALYNYQLKYLLNISFREDGSSQISPKNRFQDFYSIGVAWDITKEKFMDKQHFFNHLKIKASYGILGNQNTYGYDYPFYPLINSSSVVFGSNIIPTYSPLYETDKNLKWETVTSSEFGFEFSALKNKLFVEFAYYNKETKNLLNLVQFVGSTRATLSNIGSIINKGVELTVTWSQNITKDFSYSVNGNITTLNNTVGDDVQKIASSEERPNQTEPGFPIGYFYGYKVIGIYQSYADKLSSPTVVGQTYGPGDLKYADINGDGVIDSKDRTEIGNPTPDFIYGINLNAKYKNFELSIGLNGVYGNEIYRFWGSSENPYFRFNYPAFKLNRWNGPGTSNWDPILGSDHIINKLPSSYGIEDGSYFRIRNVQLAYNIISKLKTAVIKNVKVFLNVQNLKTFKNNSGYTPEYGGNATSFGIDNGNGAIPIIFTFGTNFLF